VALGENENYQESWAEFVVKGGDQSAEIAERIGPEAVEELATGLENGEIFADKTPAADELEAVEPATAQKLGFTATVREIWTRFVEEAPTRAVHGTRYL